MSQFNINNLCAQNVQINGRNVRINGRDVTYDEGRKIDERKVISEKGIENISIQSSLADVNITTSDSSVIEIHLYGRTSNEDKFTFINVATYKKGLAITLDESATGNLRLEVRLPKTTLQKIEVDSNVGDICIKENVSTNMLEMLTVSGNINVQCTFAELLTTTASGNIEISTVAERNIASACIQSKSGKVKTEFKNVGNMELTMQTMSGDAKNYRKCANGRYSAKVKIATMSGDIVCR